MRRRRPTEWRLLAAAAVGAALVASMPAAAAPAQQATGDPMAHLRQFVEVSTAPEYRRFGSPGMEQAADHAAATLAAAGYAVVRLDVPLTRWAPDYTAGSEPLLQRLDDGATYESDAVFSTTVTTPAEGITCTVRAIAEVGPGDCGFVPFDTASPEWNNLQANAAGAFDDILSRGGVGAVVQGDPERGARFALRVRRPLPGVVAVVDPAEILGRQVRLRVVAEPEQPAVAHEVVGVRRPATAGARSILLQGHLDGWYAAAVDNAAGAAAVLAAAERLAGDDQGLVVAIHDAEEWGLAGSQAFAAALASPTGLDVGDCGSPLQLADIAAVVNLDASSAIASDVEGPVEDITGIDVPLFQWRVLVASEEPTFAAAFVAAMTANQVLGLPVTVSVANPVNGGIARTDGRWFHEAGIPVAWPVAGYPEYHTEADTLAAVDPVDLEHLTAAAVDLVRQAATLPIGPVAGATSPARADLPLPAGCEAAAATTATTATTQPTTTASGTLLARTGDARSAPVAAAAALLAVALAALALSRWRRTPAPPARGTPARQGTPSPSGSARRP